MDNRLKILYFYVCFLIILSGIASGVSAKQLSVNKVIQNTDIKTGDSVNIALEFKNPFNKSIPITIQDNNVLGSNGLEIQCYEYTLSEGPSTTIPYDFFPIQALSAGDFTLDSATITYTNPETGNKESIKTDPLNVHITQGKDVGLQQGITKIYNCGGISMRSTSFSSSVSGSTSISISGGNVNQQVNGPAEQPNPSPDTIQQQNQDMQNIKQEIKRQQQDYKNMQDELGNRIENNSEFQRMKGELENQGYTQQERDIQPESNDSGTFEYRFKKDDESANISGKMNASKMETINKQSTEDIKNIQQYIERNETFQQMHRGLINKGYNLYDKRTDLNPNISSFEYRYSDPQGKIASIAGNVTNTGEIKDISLNEPKQPLPYWMLIFLILPLLGIYLYKKYWNNTRDSLVRSSLPVHANPKDKALERLEKAVEMFNKGMQKEAYMEASEAVRAYFKWIFGITELTSDEILKTIKGSKDELYTENVRQCFMLCDLVKFARYEPNTDDFNKVVEYAKRIIV